MIDMREPVLSIDGIDIEPILVENYSSHICGIVCGVVTDEMYALCADENINAAESLGPYVWVRPEGDG